jgi:hypothetical protein
MPKHIGRVVAAVVAAGTAGVALAASGGSSTPQPAAATQAAAQAPALEKTTMAQVAKKLGKSQDEMIKALNDMRMSAINAGKGDVKAVMVKTLASDLGISGP